MQTTLGKPVTIKLIGLFLTWIKLSTSKRQFNPFGWRQCWNTGL